MSTQKKKSSKKVAKAPKKVVRVRYTEPRGSLGKVQFVCVNMPVDLIKEIDAFAKASCPTEHRPNRSLSFRALIRAGLAKVGKRKVVELR